MGLVTSGIPRDIVQQLSRLSGAEVFVETGTFQGATTRWAAEVFPTVHTIELSPQLYNQYHYELEKLPGVHTYLGDSAEVLPEIVAQLSAAPALFWLDGHWSGNETAGQEQECPLLKELQCLRDRAQDLILIDDARLFLCAPPRPHKPEQWPTIAEVVNVFDQTRRFIQIVDDVVFMVPDQTPMKTALIDYAQTRAGQPQEGIKGPKRLAPAGHNLKRLARKLLGS